MTTLAEKLPPTPSKFCGTKSGWRSHSLRKQYPCDECRKVMAKAHSKASRFRKFKSPTMTQKQRWGEVVVTYIEPTKPDAVVPERKVAKPRKRRTEITRSGIILDNVKSWDQLSDRTKNRLEDSAAQQSAKSRAHIK